MGRFFPGPRQMCSGNKSAPVQEVHEVWSGDSRRLPSGAREVWGKSAEKPCVSEHRRILTRSSAAGGVGVGEGWELVSVFSMMSPHGLFPARTALRVPGKALPTLKHSEPLL